MPTDNKDFLRLNLLRIYLGRIIRIRLSDKIYEIITRKRSSKLFFPHPQSLHFLKRSKMNLTKTTEYFMFFQQEQMAYVSIKNCSQAIKRSTPQSGQEEKQPHIPEFDGSKLQCCGITALLSQMIRGNVNLSLHTVSKKTFENVTS